MQITTPGILARRIAFGLKLETPWQDVLKAMDIPPETTVVVVEPSDRDTAIVAACSMIGANPWAVIASIAGVVFDNLPDPDTKEK